MTSLLVLLLAAAAAAAETIQLPAEVVVSSSTAYVKGSERADRLLSAGVKAGITVLGDDGIPVVYGVRVRETEAERNAPVWRNARVIDNKLFTNDDPSPWLARAVAAAAERSASAAIEQASPPPPPPHGTASRTGRILSYRADAPFGLRRSKTTTAKPTLPAFYYQSYYDRDGPTEPPRPRYAAQQTLRRRKFTSSIQALNVVPGPSVAGSTRATHEQTAQRRPLEPTAQHKAEQATTAPTYQAFSDHSFNRPANQVLKRPDSQLKYSYTPTGKPQYGHTPASRPQYSYTPASKPQYSYTPASRPQYSYTPQKGGHEGYFTPSGNKAVVYKSPTAHTPTAYPDRPALTSAPPRRTITTTTVRRPVKSQFEHRFQGAHTPSSSGTFRFPSSGSGSASAEPAGQVLTPGSYQLPQAAADFQNTVDPFSGRPVSPDQFKIKLMSFQSMPGGPIVNIPVPIPSGQVAKPSRKPSRRFSLLSSLFGGSKRPAKDRFSASPSSAPTTYQPQYAGSAPAYSADDYYADAYREPTLYSAITDPIRRLGEGVIEFTRPVTQPFRDATDRLSQKLGLTSLYAGDELDNKQDGVGPDEALLVGGLVAGAGALAGLSFLVYANTVTNSTHYIIGRRRRSLVGLEPSGDDDLLENLVDGLDRTQASFLGRLREEGFQRWSRGPCARRIFCDFMTQRDQETIRSVSRRVTTFLSYLDKGEPYGLMAQARQLQKAIEQRQCAIYSCGGEAVDPSQIANTVDPSHEPAAAGDGRRRPTELRPR